MPALGNATHFNVDGFYYVVDHLQLNGNDSNGNGVLFNANKGKGYGFEAELGVHPVPNFRFGAGFSYLHTQIADRSVYTQVGAAGGSVAEKVLNPLVRVGNSYFAQIDGNPFPMGKTNYVFYVTVEYAVNGYAVRKYKLAVFARNVTTPRTWST